MNAQHYVIYATFLSLVTSSANAALHAVAGSWTDTTRKGRSVAQWQADFDYCEKSANRKLPLKDVKPGPIGNYYGNAIMHVRFVHTYIMLDCMPKRGWHWSGY